MKKRPFHFLTLLKNLSDPLSADCSSRCSCHQRVNLTRANSQVVRLSIVANHFRYPSLKPSKKPAKKLPMKGKRDIKPTSHVAA